MLNSQDTSTSTIHMTSCMANEERWMGCGGGPLMLSHLFTGENNLLSLSFSDEIFMTTIFLKKKPVSNWIHHQSIFHDK